jgi:hypothetical protein
MNITFFNTKRIIINYMLTMVISAHLIACGGNSSSEDVWSNYEFRHVPTSNDEYYTAPQGYGGEYGGGNDSEYYQPKSCSPGAPGTDFCM